VTYQCAKIIPYFRDVRVQANGSGICVKSIPVLVDLVVQHSDRAPEGRVLAVAIDCLLVGLVRLGILLLRHVTASQEVPALCILIVYNEISHVATGSRVKRKPVGSIPEETDFSRYWIALSCTSKVLFCWW
jgi:hypothetical protein